jgi:hypothetical protein
MDHVSEEMYRQILPGSEPAYMSLFDISGLYDNYRLAKKKNLNYELEIRLGKYGDNGKFNTGVSKDFFLTCLQHVNTYEGWTNVSDPIEFEESQYLDEAGRQIRTRTFYNSEKNNVDVIHNIKRRILIKDFQIKSELGFDINVEENIPDLRFSIASEEVVDQINDTHVTTSRVTIKQRQSFKYTPENYTEPCLQYDFSISWSGKTRSEAEKHQRNQMNTKYEIELELINDNYFNHVHTYTYPILSMTTKMIDFIYVYASQNKKHYKKAIYMLPLNYYKSVMFKT